MYDNGWVYDVWVYGDVWCMMMLGFMLMFEVYDDMWVYADVGVYNYDDDMLGCMMMFGCMLMLQ